MEVNCWICQECLTEDALATKCGHVMHSQCLKTWLERDVNSQICPVCRVPCEMKECIKIFFNTRPAKEDTQIKADNARLEKHNDNLIQRVLALGKEKSELLQTTERLKKELRNARYEHAQDGAKIKRLEKELVKLARDGPRS